MRYREIPLCTSLIVIIRVALGTKGDNPQAKWRSSDITYWQEVPNGMF